MTEIARIGAARAERTTDPRAVRARDLLESLIQDLDSGRLDPSHVIVLSGCVDESLRTSLRIDHAGSFDRFGQMGMMLDAANLFGIGMPPWRGD